MLNTHYWVVVSIPLKNISQLGLLFPIYGKTKHLPNHQPALILTITANHGFMKRNCMISTIEQVQKACSKTRRSKWARTGTRNLAFRRPPKRLQVDL
jgi:hypothetical protein